MSGGVSIHVVDVASGKVAHGLSLSIERLEGEKRMLVCAGQIAANGLFNELSDCNSMLRPGQYEVCLDVADFYRAQGQTLPAVPFLDVLVYRFGVDDSEQHYHLPFKLTAWGLSCFRGGA
ncbi:hydroxyisourate hydrolase [Pseudomonas sp. NPDC078700]|uniref:hydroxyisourate hydrolase n=1 Tax=Pseudomonas sp. NPDC078700 TaxID=3364424 RepID=UPI0037C54B3A